MKFGIWMLVGAGLLGGAGVALAQTNSPQAIQAMIANGQDQAALNALQPVLAAHPDSGVAWYLAAEAQDASGNEGAARAALSKADALAPGLPFAKPDDVAALRAHLGGDGGVVARGGHGMSPVTLLIGVVVLFLVLRMLMRRRRQYGAPGFQGGFGNRYPGPPGGPGYGPGGGGLGSSLLGGLAAGAGFAAGERVIDDVMGGNRGGMVDPAYGNPPNETERDDGLNGNPGWDDNSGGGGGFDPGNNW